MPRSTWTILSSINHDNTATANKDLVSDDNILARLVVVALMQLSDVMQLRNVTAQPSVSARLGQQTGLQQLWKEAYPLLSTSSQSNPHRTACFALSHCWSSMSCIWLPQDAAPHWLTPTAKSLQPLHVFQLKHSLSGWQLCEVQQWRLTRLQRGIEGRQGRYTDLAGLAVLNWLLLDS